MVPIEIVDGLDCFAEEFKHLDLHGKKITKAEFETCTFIACDFSEAFFSSCRFIECDFIDCNLSLIKLTSSKMSNLSFEGCKMIGIDWTMCDWTSLLTPEPIRFNECVLNDSNFFGLKLDDLVMKTSRAKEVDFRDAILKKANFTATDFKGALFEKTHLEEADFTDAQNTYIDLRSNYLQGAIFSRYEAPYLLEAMGIVLAD